MKRIFQSNNRIYFLSNIFVCLLCTISICTRFYKVENNVHYEKTELSVDTDTEPLSKVEEPKKVVTTVKTNTSSKKYVKPSYDEVTGNAIVEYAKKYLGLRYVKGGNSLSTGTDCSGFTKLIYQEFGISLSRSVSGQRYNGAYVSRGDLQKGDLIIYGNSSGTPSHVAIYIGDGMVIHESTPRYGVKISSMNMMTYITARRVITEKAKVVEETNTNTENNMDNSSNTDNTNDSNTIEENSNIINEEITNNNETIVDNTTETSDSNQNNNSSNSEENNASENNNIYTKSEYGTSN